MTYRVNRNASVGGTSLRGYYGANYRILVCAFGEPETFDDDCGDGKVSTEWTFEGDDGSVWTLYDWKATTLHDPSTVTPRRFRQRKWYDWHVGGCGDPTAFLAWVEQTVSQAAAEKYAATKAKARATREANKAAKAQRGRT